MLVAFFLLDAAPPAIPARDDSPRKLEDWYKGPVRYLMNRTETKLFRRLDTNAERVEFIRNFWQRRDPNPVTPENEARVAFWTRVAEANGQFSDAAMIGWKTDRGKIYILLGPPDKIDSVRDYRTREEINDPTIAHRGLLRWQYEGLERAANRAITVVAFIKRTNDWELTDDPKLNSIFLNVTSPETEATRIPAPLERILDRVPWGAGTMSTAMDLGRLQEAPTESQLLRAVVTTEEFIGTYSGRLETHGASDADGRRLTALTVALDRSELIPAWDGSATGLSQRFVVTAQLELQGEGPLTKFEIPEDSWAPEPTPDPEGRWLRFQSIRDVPPGEWRISIIVFDREGGGAATIYSDLSVTDEGGGGPAVTGPILAESIIPSPLPLRSTERTETAPFRMIDHIVVPRIGRQIRPDEEFALYLEVLPPTGATTPVTLEWQFHLTADGTEAPFGEPGRLDDARGPRAWQVPASRMPAGTYRVVFVARIEGALPITRELVFEVLGEAS